MTQEQKELLLKDLSSRFPYGVKIHAKYTELGETIEVDGIVKMIDDDGVVGIEVIYDTSSAWTCVQIDNIKPYLFPLSSMTKEQTEELIKLINTGQNDNNEFMRSICRIEFYHKHHLDYRGLIPKGLAIDAAGLNIY